MSSVLEKTQKQHSNEDGLDIPEFLKISEEDRQKAWEQYQSSTTSTASNPKLEHPATIDKCFSCGRTFVRGTKDGRFCHPRCREWFDNGNPPYEDNKEAFFPTGFPEIENAVWRVVAGPPGYRKGDIYTGCEVPRLLPGKNGFLIKCSNCNKKFDSKGLRCCSKECEKEFTRKEEGLQYYHKYNQQKHELKKEKSKMELPSIEFAKQQLYNLCDALQVSRRRINLRNGHLTGRHGSITADAKAWYLVVNAKSNRQWRQIRGKLSFLFLVDSTSDAGSFKAYKMPTLEEATIIRKIVGLKKKPALSKEYRATLPSRLQKPTYPPQNSPLTKGAFTH